MPDNRPYRADSARPMRALEDAPAAVKWIAVAVAFAFALLLP